VIQYALRSTQKPNTHNWVDLWNNALAVWSYYDLIELCKEDGADCKFNFYHGPLGTRFNRGKEASDFLIATSGLSYLTESVRECMAVANELNKKVFHVGPNLGYKNTIYSDGIDDELLAYHYSHCEYVSGLRRIEGFEFPVIEGLMCGARPIVFDKPHYRKWFNNYAIFIQENDRENVKKALQEVLRRDAIPVSEKEKLEIKNKFSWDTIFKELKKQIWINSNT